MSKIYYTHDNGGRPFKVIVTPSTFTVFKGIYDSKTDTMHYDKQLLKPQNYLDIFIGNDKGNKFKGNSLLFKVKDKKYIHIGYEIYSFHTPDNIIKYCSPVGNNDVPYPYALGEENTYLIIDNVYIPNAIRMQKIDPYHQYYHHYEDVTSQFRKIVMDNHRSRYSYKKKVLIERQM